jgi:hypothetical protein
MSALASSSYIPQGISQWARAGDAARKLNTPMTNNAMTDLMGLSPFLLWLCRDANCYYYAADVEHPLPGAKPAWAPPMRTENDALGGAIPDGAIRAPFRSSLPKESYERQKP